MEKTKKNAHEEEEETDLINNLPDSILCLIICYLPIKQVVRTSILCKRWKKLWMSIPSINFDLQKPNPLNKNLNKEVREVIDHIFTSHHGKIESCWIKHCRKNIKHHEVQRWIEQLKSNRRSINKLSLQCMSIFAWKWYHIQNKERYQLPSRIFSFSSLHELELNNYNLWDSSPFEGCMNLTTLKLVSILLKSDVILQGIIFNCGLLENLSLIRCEGLQTLKILDRNLRVLKIENLQVKGIEIHDMSLRTLVIDTLSSGNGYKITTPNLQQLCITHRHHASALIDINWTGIEIIEVSSNFRANPYKEVSPFENLQRLFLNLNLKDVRQAPMLASMLRRNRYLQELIIELVEGAEKFDPFLAYGPVVVARDGERILVIRA
ncbi:F-box protein At1g80960-like [Telopea speciosissima]|uniref:F-box protein At1g80960-like n=1 Tax=Telopea speciosissima TaxID=54955 RepID=UPI001CC6FE1B|nr:F-box protein At1g80960-like [Telopea speciosissima]